MISRNKGILLVLLLVAINTAGCGLGPRQSDQEPLTGGWIESSLEVDGLTRWYRLYLPNQFPENAPVVLYLHGGTLSMRSIFNRYAGGTKEWFSLADQEGLVFLVPNGVNPETGARSECCN